VPLEGFCKFKKFDSLVGIRTRDLPACSIEPQSIGSCSEPDESETSGSVTRRYGTCLYTNSRNPDYDYAIY
jgi:hypothetical protein